MLVLLVKMKYRWLLNNTGVILYNLVLSLHFMCSTSTFSLSTDKVKHQHTPGHMWFKGQL